MPEVAAPGAGAVRTAASAGLTAYLTASCVGCHGPKKQEKGIRLDDPATVPPDVRDRCFREVSAGKMPKDGPKATAQQLGEIYRWAEDGGRALEVTRAAFIRPDLSAPPRRTDNEPRAALVRKDYRKQTGHVPER